MIRAYSPGEPDRCSSRRLLHEPVTLRMLCAMAVILAVFAVIQLERKRVIRAA